MTAPEAGAAPPNKATSKNKKRLAILRIFITASARAPGTGALLTKLLNHAIARRVRLAGQLHAMLYNEGCQQRIHRSHDGFIAVDLEMAVLLDGPDTLILDVTRHHAGECPAQ